MSRFTDRTGETIISKNGMKATIIKYRNSRDIDVQFENNLIVKHRSYDSFKKGTISTQDRRPKNEKIGLTSIATNKQKITIINYNNSHDLDIKFEDGLIIKHCSYDRFLKGTIRHPTSDIRTKVNRIGETNIAKNGLKMTIISYKQVNNIDIQFEDGTIVEHKTYKSFKKGEISHPTIKIIAKYHIGETNISSCGLKMTIIAYRGIKDIDIKFEDGITVYNKSYNNFKRGYIKYPLPYQINNILVEKLAYIELSGIGNFYCTCTKCNHKDIWTIEEAKNHICKE